MKTRAIVVAVIVILLAGMGVYFLRHRIFPSSPAAGGGTAQPASIKVFRLNKPNLTALGENLSKVEIWAVMGGTPKLLGEAALSAENGPAGMPQIWTLPVPAGLKGASEIYARGYNTAGSDAAKIDLSMSDLRSL